MSITVILLVNTEFTTSDQHISPMTIKVDNSTVANIRHRSEAVAK